MKFIIYKHTQEIGYINYTDWCAAEQITGINAKEIEQAYRRRKYAYIHSFEIGIYSFRFVDRTQYKQCEKIEIIIEENGITDNYEQPKQSKS